MYFDVSPKTRKIDLFGMDYQLEIFKKYLKDKSVRMVVIKGLRRVGKTSLLNVGLLESELKYVKIDVRDSPFYDKKEFLIFLIKKIKEKADDYWDKTIDKITGMAAGYGSFSFELFFSKEENISSFFEHLNEQLQKKKESLILAFDEVQLLKQTGFDYFLASVFDNYRQIKIVLTGSEIGLMDQFLGKEEYEAPLFGRAYLELVVGRIKEESVAKFLEEGFRQIHHTITIEEIREVIGNFDGIMGGGTYYGWFRSKGFSHPRALEKVKEEGKTIIRKELEHFLAKRRSKNNYLKTIQYLAKGKNTWAALKQNFAKEGTRLADSQLSLYLKELMNVGFVEKINEQYFLVDPLLGYA